MYADVRVKKEQRGLRAEGEQDSKQVYVGHLVQGSKLNRDGLD